MSVGTKVARTFVFAFLGPFSLCLINVLTSLSNTVDWSVAKSAVVSGAFAAGAAGVRAIVAYLPVFPDDNVGLQKK